MKQNTLNKALVIAGLLILTILCRLITNKLEMWNFTAMGAGALFAGVMLKDKRFAYAVPLISLFVSDLIFQFFTDIPGFYGGQQIFVYGAFLLITWIGLQIKKVNVLTMLVAAIGTGLLFFLISNFGTWATSGIYPRTWSGLITCYAAAIPFYRNDLFGSFLLNTVMGEVFYTAVLFGAYALATRILFHGRMQTA